MLKLAFWAMALAFGAYLGNGAAIGLAQSGIASLNALVAGVIAVTILVILAILAILAVLMPDRRGRPAARALVIAGALLVVGIGGGWAFSVLTAAPDRLASDTHA